LFSFQYIKQICDALAPFNIPIILFGKNTTLHLKKQLELPIHVIGVDSFLPLKKARDIVQSKVALQGNLNPELLLTNPETITKAVKEILNQMKNDSAFIFNLGHGILPTTPLDHVQLVVDMVQNV
jgi:uroporphyrinogen decarboxylase